MTITTAAFENPPNIMIPTDRELVDIARSGTNSKPDERAQRMNAIGSLLSIPSGGWTTGISRMFANGDIRIVQLLRRLTQPTYASKVGNNLRGAARYIDIDVLLTLTVAAREYAESVGAVGTQSIETFQQGGLDHLGSTMKNLGLPPRVTNRWHAVPTYDSSETLKPVYPAEIPAEDQVLAYAAQMNSSFKNAFQKFWSSLAADQFPRWTGCRVALMTWRAYAFLRPGGQKYDPQRGIHADQQVGIHSALTYLAETARPGEGHQLDRILTNELNRFESIRIAKVRVAEALYLESLLQDLRGAAN